MTRTIDKQNDIYIFYVVLFINARMFKKIEATLENKLIFFNEWAKGLTSEEMDSYQGEIFFCDSIKEVVSGKGFMLKFSLFTIFIWKKSAVAVTVEKMFEEEEGSRLAIQLRRTKKLLDYDFGIDDSEVFYFELNHPEEDTLEFISREEMDKRKEMELIIKAAREQRKTEKDKVLKAIDKAVTKK